MLVGPKRHLRRKYLSGLMRICDARGGLIEAEMALAYFSAWAALHPQRRPQIEGCLQKHPTANTDFAVINPSRVCVFSFPYLGNI